MPCTLCKVLPKHVATDKRHERLQQIGLTERVSNPGRAKASWITYYLCEICETKWRHVDDPVNRQAGWSIEKHRLTPERPDIQAEIQAAPPCS